LDGIFDDQLNHTAHFRDRDTLIGNAYQFADPATIAPVMGERSGSDREKTPNWGRALLMGRNRSSFSYPS
jgi:hypothetical protein